MITPREFVELGRHLEDGLSLLAGDLHVKDDGYAELATAANVVRARADEVSSLLALPGMQEKLTASAALSQAAAIPKQATLEQQHVYFVRVYQSLDSTLANALRATWVGDWEMNDDGLTCKLTVLDLSAQSTNAAAPNLQITYTDSQGRAHQGWVKTIDQRWHHIHFFVGFDGLSRKFDAYLLRWDKRKLAGVTEGKGFYANKL